MAVPAHLDAVVKRDTYAKHASYENVRRLLLGPDPLRFDPDRWQPEQEAARHPFAYHPFAGGQRVCIGNNFSLFESHVLVAMLARHFVLHKVPGHTPQWWMDGTLGSRNGLPMTVARR